MKKILKNIIPFTIIFFMFGCSGKDNSFAEDTETATMPVLTITTTNQSANVMDFVTKPIDGYVAEQIASWTPGYQMPPEPYYEECSITLTDAEGTETLTDAIAQVKVRGNWTTNYEKKPLRIKFQEKQNLLGLNDGAKMKNWVLTAEYKDTSMLRNKTALQIAREILGKDGLYVADAAFVEVNINGQYWGVYLLTEYQQINEDRVNITKAEDDYTGTDIGYFLEFDGYYFTEDELQNFYVDYAGNAALLPFDGDNIPQIKVSCQSNGFNKSHKNVGFTIKNDIYSEEQRDFIASYINNVYRIMYYAAYKDKAYVFNSDYTEISESTALSPKEAVEAVVNTASLADMYIISELTCDADIYWSSFFMDVDFGENGDKKLTFEAPWDFDSALGNKDRCADGTGFWAANMVPDVNNEYYTINPWLAVLMHEDWFQEIIRDKWTDAYDSGVFERAYASIEKDTSLYREAFARNYEKWDNLKNNQAFVHELSAGSAACRTHKESAEYLTDWLQKRVDFLNDYWHK